MTSSKPAITMTSRQVLTYDGLTIISETPMAGAALVLKLQNMIVQLVSAQLGQAEADKVAVKQGEDAADVLAELPENLNEAAKSLGLKDRRKAPLRKVTWSNGRSKKEKLECGHTFDRPSGHEPAKKRRCVACVAEAVSA